jgi:hypothetical protein
MFAQLGDYRIRHALATMNFRSLSAVDGGVPTAIGITMSRDGEIASAYSNLQYFLKFDRRFPLLVHAIAPFDVRFGALRHPGRQRTALENNYLRNSPPIAPPIAANGPPMPRA